MDAYIVMAQKLPARVRVRMFRNTPPAMWKTTPMPSSIHTAVKSCECEDVGFRSPYLPRKDISRRRRRGRVYRSAFWTETCDGDFVRERKLYGRRPHEINVEYAGHAAHMPWPMVPGTQHTCLGRWCRARSTHALADGGTNRRPPCPQPDTPPATRQPTSTHPGRRTCGTPKK